MSPILALDILALVWFLVAWIGYTIFADRPPKRIRTLVHAVQDYRVAWMRRMLERDNRMTDAAVITAIMNSISFFASTSLFILTGLLAAFGAIDPVLALLEELPYAAPASRAQVHSKLLLLLAIFIYAFFKFTWSIRQYNYTSILIAAAPLKEETGFDKPEYAQRAARVAARGTEHYNRGIRAYYFGLALLSWFIHPLALMAASTWVVLVMYRREFHSHTLRELEGGERYLPP